MMVQIEDGCVQFVAIKSLHGNTLKLQNPWSKAYLNGELFKDNIITVETKTDNLYLFTKTANEEFNFVQQKPVQNNEQKVHKDNITTLGTHRSF